MSRIKEGIQKKLIHISEDGKQITYSRQNNKKRNFANPEEQVQVETYLKLVFDYKYKPERIKIYESVKMGSETKEADIIVYNDDECSEPHILVECKKQEVSEAEFQQAIEQAYSYAYALPNDVKYIWVTSEIKNEYFEVDKKKKTRTAQPDIPQFGVKKLANYKYVYDAENVKTKEGEQQFNDLSTISQDELTRRFKQAHDALWGGGQLNPSEAFDELDKLIFCKIWDERKDRKIGEAYDFQIITVDKEEIKNWNKLGERELHVAVKDLENRRLTERIANLYEEGRKKDPEVFRDNIRLSPEKIRTVVGYLESVDLGETDLDAKGRAFETFMDSFFRGNFGQYFTPRPIVKFTTDVLPITNDSLVLDTSCGSGGFLLYSLDKVRKQANELYPNYKADTKQYAKHYKCWHDFAERNLFGIEINEQISRAAKMNMIIHDDGHTNVITADGLLSPEKLENVTKNRGFKYNTFDFIVTNPPFGSIVRQTEKAYMREFRLGKKEEDWLAVITKPETQRENQSTEILFIEQAHRFLKEGGYLGIVIPDGILTNSSLQYVRNQIEDWFRIVAVVSMPQTAFMSTGAGVKSSVIFLRKWTKAETEKIAEQKATLQTVIKSEAQYLNKIEAFEQEKKRIIKEHDGFVNTTGETEKKKIEATDRFKAWKAEINADYTQKINDLKDELSEIYQIRKAQTLADYPIFMAIAEDIGYDATGKPTGNNELDMIGEELTKFIDAIENNEI
jgi:type I restriction enzyme M protein